MIFNVTDPLADQTGLLVGLRHEAVRLCQVTEGRPAQGGYLFRDAHPCACEEGG